MFSGTVGALNVSCKQENMYVTDLGMDYILYIIYLFIVLFVIHSVACGDDLCIMSYVFSIFKPGL